MHNTVVYMYLHSYKINNSKYTEYQKKPSCKMHKSLHLLLYCQTTIYWEGKKKVLLDFGAEELRCTALCTLHTQLYVCMYFIACYYELLMLILYEL